MSLKRAICAGLWWNWELWCNGWPTDYQHIYQTINSKDQNCYSELSNGQRQEVISYGLVVLSSVNKEMKTDR